MVNNFIYLINFFILSMIEIIEKCKLISLNKYFFANSQLIKFKKKFNNFKDDKNESSGKDYGKDY